MAENLGLFFLWIVTHSSGRTFFLLLELFSSVSVDDLFTEPQAFTAKPSHHVPSWIKTALHHTGFHQLTTKAHTQRCFTYGKDGEQALTCPHPAFSAWMRFCYLWDCFHGISDGNWIQAQEILWGRCATGNFILTSNIYKDIHSHTKGMSELNEKDLTAGQYITSSAKLDL